MGRYVIIVRYSSAISIHCFLVISQGTPSINNIKSYLGRLRRLLTMLSRYQDPKTIEEFQAQQRTLEAMLAAAENDETQKDATDSK